MTNASLLFPSNVPLLVTVSGDINDSKQVSSSLDLLYALGYLIYGYSDLTSAGSLELRALNSLHDEVLNAEITYGDIQDRPISTKVRVDDGMTVSVHFLWDALGAGLDVPESSDDDDGYESSVESDDLIQIGGAIDLMNVLFGIANAAHLPPSPAPIDGVPGNPGPIPVDQLAGLPEFVRIAIANTPDENSPLKHVGDDALFQLALLSQPFAGFDILTRRPDTYVVLAPQGSNFEFLKPGAQAVIFPLQ